MDEFHYRRDAVSDPARSAVSVTSADAAELQIVPKAIFVGSGGDVHLRCVDDDSGVIFRNVPDGAILPVRAQAVLASGTTASDIVALA